MFPPLPVRWTLRAALALLCAPVLARAADKFEIQVYQGEHNDPGKLSLELHTNYTLAGHSQPSFEGETPADGALRLTLEPAIGVTEWLEAGAYIQAMGSPNNGMQFGGWKLRTKFIAPEKWKLPVTLGLNVELGRVPRAVEEEGWANEFRPIVGVEFGRVAVTINPIVGFALTGPEAGKPDFEPAMKAKVNSNQGFALGIEYYAALGRFDAGFLPVREQDHLLFAVVDTEPPVGAFDTSEWELNIGIGKSLTSATPQDWIVKCIVGRSF